MDVAAGPRALLTEIEHLPEGVREEQDVENHRERDDREEEAEERYAGDTHHRPGHPLPEDARDACGLCEREQRGKCQHHDGWVDTCADITRHREQYGGRQRVQGEEPAEYQQVLPVVDDGVVDRLRDLAFLPFPGREQQVREVQGRIARELAVRNAELCSGVQSPALNGPEDRDPQLVCRERGDVDVPSRLRVVGPR